ncbi:polyprenyl synthetase family protein [Helicobacter cholecystus]|nr:polyprenyl synthetase family protein [Helicobacter cholecystus]VEJ24066.1 polyprenyl synthetase [Helicobacter cholecystus]
MSNDALQKVKEQIKTFLLEFDNPFIHKLSSKLAQGKMLRSRLVFAIAGVSKESIKLCSIIELIQLASLLHDDVIDGAMTRRNSASLNALFGNKNSIMLGDALYSKAYAHLLYFPSEIAQSIANSVCALSSGEIRDVFLSQSFNPSLSEYLLMIKEKTASLIASTAQSAALLVGEDCGAYYHYGECLGIAFQIVDDILDITQNEKILGKPAMTDFLEGKTTLPYIFLYDVLPQEERDILASLHHKSLDKEQKVWLFERFEKYRIINQSFEYAKEYAKSAVCKLPKGYNTELDAMIEAMIERYY